MACQTEALDLSKGVTTTESAPEQNSSDEEISVCGKVRAEEPEDQPAAKRPRLEEVGQHSAVLQWLAKNSFDQSPPGVNTSLDSTDDVNAPKSELSPLQHGSKPPSMISPVPMLTAPPLGFPAPGIGRTVEGVTVTLQDNHLWSAFNHTGTEMIINKSGRRMFPYVTVSVEGLEYNALYSFYLEIIQVDDNCYKYVNKQWAPVGVAETMTTNPPVIHPDSPKTGSFWMKGTINFASVKITNTPESDSNKIYLRSMHKYMTRLHVVRGSPGLEDISSCPTYIFNLPETSFVAVTAYKNKAITYMKIMNNPFAKPYRESTKEAPPRARCLRKLFNAQNSEEKKSAENKNPVPQPLPKPAPAVLPTPLWYPHAPLPFPPPPSAPFYMSPPALFPPYAPLFRPLESSQMTLPLRITL